MKTNTISRSNLFLIELIIVIMFFAFASAIILQVFVKANHLASNTVALNGAVIIAQTAAEKEKVSNFSELSKIMNPSYYDKDWQPTDKANYVYALNIKIKSTHTQSGTLVTFTNIITSREDTLYTLESKKYYSNDRGAYQ